MTTSHPQNFLDADHLHLASYIGKTKQKQSKTQWSATHTFPDNFFAPWLFIVGKLAAACETCHKRRVAEVKQHHRKRGGRRQEAGRRSLAVVHAPLLKLK